MKCVKCGKEISENAKFCRYCGSQVENVDVAKASEKICPQCSQSVSTNAKFCRYCRYEFNSSNAVSPAPKAPPTSNDEATYEVKNNYITWNIMPGQLAVKITEKEMASYGKVRGLYITPGTVALFFINGKYTATLEGGKYPFNNEYGDEEESTSSKRKTVIAFMKNIAVHIKDGIMRFFGKEPPVRGQNSEKVFYTVVLIRESDFSLVFTPENISTKNIRSEVGLHIRCKLTDYEQFFISHMTDCKFISLESFAAHLVPTVKAVLNDKLSSVLPQDVTNNSELSHIILDALNEKFHEFYPYLSADQIVDLTANQSELEAIRHLKEELYIAEQELEQSQLRSDFLNKMQNLEYDNALRSARQETDFLALMDKIDEDRLLNDDKKAQFALMLASQRLLREATTETEVQNALNGLVKSRLMSEEEISILQREISFRSDNAMLSHSNEIAMGSLQGQIERQTVADAYSDKRRNADFEFENQRMNSKMELLRQAQAMREEREQAAHKRELENKKIELDAQLEQQRIASTMTFEQIMASNPNISPDAAAALAKKFEAAAIANANDKTSELQKQHSEVMMNILMQQMNLTKDVLSAQTQANINVLSEKEKELNRVREATEHHQDRMLSGMKETLNAASKISGSNIQTQQPNLSMQVRFCPNCGATVPGNSGKCSKCGESIT